jgi:hypothetical protein
MKLFKKTLLIIILIPIALLGWGGKGHNIITKYAMQLLPVEMNLSIDIKDDIIAHSIDPDLRKRDVKDEYPKHFIDIDFYKEFREGKMIQSYDSLLSIYGDSVVTDMGTLPWATLQSYSYLVDAFMQKDKQKIILYGSDISHYIEDGHQPQHTTLNYNGQLTNQTGIHFRYESDMINKFLNEIEDRYYAIQPGYISDLSGYIFDFISESNSYNELILIADRQASELTSGVFNDDYYKLLWFKTKYVTFNRVSMGANRTASLIYSAWVDAGKPQLDHL